LEDIVEICASIGFHVGLLFRVFRIPVPFYERDPVVGQLDTGDSVLIDYAPGIEVIRSWMLPGLIFYWNLLWRVKLQGLSFFGHQIPIEFLRDLQGFFFCQAFKHKHQEGS
jgi:hypothetical protein